MRIRTAGYSRCIRGLLVLLVGLTFLAGSNQRGDAQSNTDELRRWISLGAGAVVGVGFAVYHGVLLFGHTPNLAIEHKLLGFFPPVALAVATSIGTTYLFFELFANLKSGLLVSIPLGGVAGCVEGALIGGLSYALFFPLVQAVDPTFMNSSPSLLQAAAMGFLGAGLFGAMIGAIPGAVAAPIVQAKLPAGQ